MGILNRLTKSILSSGSSSKSSSSIEWKELTKKAQLKEIAESENVEFIFKHSTRCSISSMAASRLKREWDLDFPIYYLDLITYRSISNQIATDFGVTHQSPQFLVIKNGKCVYHASHNSISVDKVRKAIQ